MSTVLVTGANGFVGRHLLKELHTNGVHVVGVGGRLNKQKPEYVDAYYELDLLDPNDVAKIDLTEITGIVHLAGLASPGASFAAPMDYIAANLGIETNLFEHAIKQNVKPRFLIVSSGTLYSPKASLPFTEISATIPSSPYAVSKLGQEQMAQYYGLRGFDCVIVRPFNHIGPGQNLGFIVPDLAKQVIEYSQGDIPAVRTGNLDAKRDYTDVRDIVRAYRFLLENGKTNETYNICSGVALSGTAILSLISEAVGCKPIVEQDQALMRPSDNPVLYGDHNKITKDTGWEPQIPLEVTIRDVIADWRQRLGAQ